MRTIFCAAALLCLAACAPPRARPGTLLLWNSGSASAKVETAVTTSPSCTWRGRGTLSATEFPLPGDATRFIAVPSGADVCWRHAVVPTEPDKPKWSDWSRAFTASGRRIDSEL